MLKISVHNQYIVIFTFLNILWIQLSIYRLIILESICCRLLLLRGAYAALPQLVVTLLALLNWTRRKGGWKRGVRESTKDGMGLNKQVCITELHLFESCRAKSFFSHPFHPTRAVDASPKQLPSPLTFMSKTDVGPSRLFQYSYSSEYN